MRRIPWKALFVMSLALMAAGCAMLIWSILQKLGWQGAIIAIMVIVLGSLLARMNYRAYRYAVVPAPSTTLPIIGVGAGALLWIASVVGLL